MQRTDVIRSAVLRASILYVSNQIPQELIEYLSSNDTRCIVYECCLELINEEQRRHDVGLLMLNYIPSYPPSRAVMGEILERCELFVRKTPYAAVYKDLQSVLEAYYNHVPFYYLRGKGHHACKPPMATRWGEINANPTYIVTFALQTPMDGLGKGQSFVNFRLPKSTLANQDEEEPNALQCSITNIAVSCKDYLNQSPLVCSEDVVEQQLGVLSHFWIRFRNHPSVLSATSFLIKLMCDAYVAKIPLGPPYQFFRTVSVSYLPELFNLMESDYLCVRNHVYDFLLTLGLHFQLVDTRGVYEGATEALQRELIWILLCVLERQALMKPYDELTWTAAAKCALAVIPPRFRHLIDCRALYQFMTLPGLAELHPKLFGIITEPFVDSLIHHAPGDGGDASGFVLNEESYGKLGTSATANILALYRKAETTGARLALFRLLFTCAIATVQREEKEPLHPQMVRQCFDALISLEVYWYLHPLLFYHSQRLLKEFAGHVSYDLDPSDYNNVSSLTVKTVQEMLHIIAEDATLPTSLMDAIVHGDHEFSTVLQEAVGIVPTFLKDTSDVRIFNMGWRLALYCVCACREKLDPPSCKAFLRTLIQQLVCHPDATDDRERYQVRRVLPDLLTSLLILCRTQAGLYIGCVADLMEEYLFGAESDLTVPAVMTLATRIVECTDIRNVPLSNHRSCMAADVPSLVFSEYFVIPLLCVQAVGPRILWALYRALGSGSTIAVCRMRYLLVSVLLALDTDETASLTAWHTVALDPCRRVARVGEQKKASLLRKTASRKV